MGKTKRNTDIVQDDSNVIVYYTINPNTDKPTSWTYGKFPTGWWWVGAGSAGCGYNQEEQFTGPPKSQAALETLLTTQFEKLKKAGVVTKFKLFRKYPSCRPKKATRRVGHAVSRRNAEEGTGRKGVGRRHDQGRRPSMGPGPLDQRAFQMPVGRRLLDNLRGK